MEHIFIDTNIFLSFYHYSSDDLDELMKLSSLIDDKKILLYLPFQVVDEFYRNREIKINDALKKFKDEKLSNQFPQICKEYSEYNSLKKALVEYQSLKNKLLDELENDIKKNDLKADHVITDLFEKSINIKYNEKVISNSKLRFDRGNPPGKNGSYGDAINWECLLNSVPDKVKLYFISEDKDYHSTINPVEFLPFLKKEWEIQKNGEIIYYKQLSLFFKDHQPTIKINDEDENEKVRLIYELSVSSNFAYTRRTLRQLVQYSDFTDEQINDIVNATISNNQIYWIAEDEDINNYLKKLIEGYEDNIASDNLEMFKSLVYKNNDENVDSSEENNDLPF